MTTQKYPNAARFDNVKRRAIFMRDDTIDKQWDETSELFLNPYLKSGKKPNILHKMD